MPFPQPGGSCLVSCRIDDFDSNGNLIAHGYVKENHLYTSLIQSQLQQMYANGQRRLSIAVPYFEGGDSFALDSSDGMLKLQDSLNLLNLVNTAKVIGFGEFVVEMIPEWSASFANWMNPAVMGTAGTRTFQPLSYDRDFSFTLSVARAMDTTGVFYHMDLIGEGTSDTKVCERFWSDWCDQYGGPRWDLGFSMIPTQDSIDSYDKIYTNGIHPLALSVHAYNNPAEMSWDQWKAATAMWPQGYVVGESLCDSPDADAIFTASPSRLFYRFVWPINSNTLGPNVTQNCLTVNQKF